MPTPKELVRSVFYAADPAARLGEIFGIRVVTASWQEAHDIYGEDLQWGPANAGRARRQARLPQDSVVIRWDLWNDLDMVLPDIWHEIMRLICWRDDQSNEDLLLVPVEEAYTKACLPGSRQERVLRELWTHAHPYAQRLRVENLEDDPHFRRRKFWLDGKRIARQVGLLDDKNYPTFKYPDWSKLSEEDCRMLEKAPYE